MLNDCLIQALKQWIKLEPKHTQKVKEVIVENIEKKKISSLLEMDELLKDEYCERIYRNHNLNKDEMKKLKKIKSPSVILLISNEPEHEIAEKIKKYNKEKVEENKLQIKDKIEYKILKMKTLIEFLINYENDYDNDINTINDNEDEQTIDIQIREIKIRKRWEIIKEKWKKEVANFVKEIIDKNKGKKDEEIDAKEIYSLILKLRQVLSNSSKEIIQAAEIGIELEEQMNFLNKVKIKKKNKGPGRPKKDKNEKDKTQTNLNNFINLK